MWTFGTTESGARLNQTAGTYSRNDDHSSEWKNICDSTQTRNTEKGVSWHGQIICRKPPARLFYVGVPCVRCCQWRDNGTYIDRTLPDIVAQEFWMSSLSDWENLRRLAVLFLLMVKESCDDGYSQGSAEVRRTHSTSVTWQECIRRDLDT